MKLRSLLISGALALSPVVMAAEFTVDGISYIEVEGEGLQVKKATDTYNLTIPATVVYNDSTYTVTSIGNSAFYGKALYTVTLPSTIKYIGNSAFSSSKLVSIELNEGLESLGNYAFQNCKNIIRIDLPSTVNNIGRACFSTCEALEAISVPENVNMLDEQTFMDCKGLREVILPSKLFEIKGNCFGGCSSLEKIGFPESVVSIGSYAFQYSGLTKVALPSKMTIINTCVFRGCEKLAYVDLPSNLQSIESSAFEGCKRLSRIAFPEKTRTLENGAFLDCKGLKEVYIPSSVIKLDNSYNPTFRGCDSITDVHVRGYYPVNFGKSQFVKEGSDSAAMTLYVPAGRVDAYCALDCYAGFGKIVEENIAITMESQRRMIVGTKTRLNVAPTPAIYPLGSLDWQSSNKAAATVDAYGNVTAVSPGTAVITASATVEGSKIEARCTVIVTAAPAASLVITPTTLSAGSNAYLPVELVNENPVISFQCDIYLPEEMDFFTDDENEFDFIWGGRESRRHILESRRQADGSVRVVGYATDNSAFSGNQGTLFSIPVSLPALSGDYEISIRNILVTDKQLTESPLIDVTGTVYVGGLVVGDANSDGRVTVNDAAYASAYILGETFEGFNISAADVIADGNITMADVSEIINIVLGATLNSPAKHAAAARANGYTNPVREGDKMYIDDLEIKAGETVTLEVKMKNDEPFISFHSEIVLPEGLHFVEEDGEYWVDLASGRKTRSHTIASRLQPDGRLRVVSYSSNNSAFKGNDGTLFTVEVKADSDFDDTKPSEIKLENNYIVNRDETKATDYDVPDWTAIVNPSTSSIDRVGENPARIYVTDGNVLNIESPVAGSVNLVAIDGTSRRLDVAAGHNAFVIDRPGIYIVNNAKVVIR